MIEAPFIGDWTRERSLGSGGFGTVILWKNTKTKEAVGKSENSILTHSSHSHESDPGRQCLPAAR